MSSGRDLLLESGIIFVEWRTGRVATIDGVSCLTQIGQFFCVSKGTESGRNKEMPRRDES